MNVVQVVLVSHYDAVVAENARLREALTLIANGIGWNWETYNQIALLALHATVQPSEP